MNNNNLNDIKSHVHINKDGLYWPINGEWTYNQLKLTLNHADIFQKYLKNYNTMVQAGGNCGLALMPYLDKFKQIYTFEPDPINFYCLNLNIDKKNVHKFQSCLGDKHELISMDLVDPNDNGSFFVNNNKGNVVTLRIDDLNLSDCNLIFLDVEGFELSVLKGAVETIKKYKPLLCLEVMEPWLQRAGSSREELFNFLKENKYEIKEYVHVDMIAVHIDNL